MSNELVPKFDVVHTSSLLDEKLEHEFFNLPDLTQAVVNFIRYFPNRFHYVLSATPESTLELIKRHVPSLDERQLQVVHPFTGTVGWVSKEPNQALSSMVLLNDPGSFNQVCCRLRHEDAAYYVWAKFDVHGMNGSLIRSMSPHLFRHSHDGYHLYTGLKDFNGMCDLPSPRMPTQLLGVKDGY